MERKSNFNFYERGKKYDEYRPKRIVWNRMYSKVDNFAIIAEDNIARRIHEYGIISGVRL